MKLLDFDDYRDTPVPGISFDLLKFRRRSVVILTLEESSTTNFPSVMVCVGPVALFELSLGLVKYYVSIAIWDKHYDH